MENEKIKRKYSTLTRRRTVDAGKEKKNNNAGKAEAKEMFIKVFCYLHKEAKQAMRRRKRSWSWGKVMSNVAK